MQTPKQQFVTELQKNEDQTKTLSLWMMISNVHPIPF